MDAGTWVGIGGVVMAFAAVIASLLQEDLRRWMFPPTIQVGASITVFHVPDEARTQYVPHAFVRLKVSTTARSAPADDVLVSLLSCHPPPKLGGKIQINDQEMLRPLRWAFEHVETVDLVPGAGRHVDLAEVSGADPKHARLTTTDAPSEGLMLDACGDDYNIEVLIAGRNFRPVRRVVHLRHAGTWTGQGDPPATAVAVRISDR